MRLHICGVNRNPSRTMATLGCMFR